MKVITKVSVLILLGFVYATFFAGCGGGSVAGGGQIGDAKDSSDVADSGIFQDAGKDLSDAQDVSKQDVEVMDVGEDVLDGEEVIKSGEFGAPCLNNKDCKSGYCIETPDGFVCTKTCVTECPNNWICRTTFVGQDLVSICMPPSGTVCRPCKTDSQCALGRCIKLGNEEVCGLDCDSDKDCPEDYKCEEIKERDIKQCVPVSGTCTCTPRNANEERVCANKKGKWTCYGTQVCDPKKGWSECDAPQPQQEVCNGKDDNCNGVTDEDVVPPKASCSIKNEYGECKGHYVCAGEKGWQCEGKTPAPEVCNNEDDDCDGKIDEDWPMKDSPCTVGVGACQRTGVMKCSKDGKGLVCSAKPGPPMSKELCNGIDDDCDGETDEDFPEKNKMCTVGVGMCQRTGIYVCSDDAEGVVCSAKPGEPTKELCNGLDDDCDGRTDEDFPQLGKACTGGQGECAAQGVYVCKPSGNGVMCNAIPKDPKKEVCDGKDDDCNGITDDPNAIGCRMFYLDKDKDGFGKAGSGKCLCGPEGDYTAINGGDCNDNDKGIYPFSSRHCTKDAECCAPTDKCIRGHCVEMGQKCHSTADCSGDYYCDPQYGRCLPWDVHPGDTWFGECTRKIKVGIFRPHLQCSWTTPPHGDIEPTSRNVIATPMVADFDFDNNPDTVKPSIVFVTVTRAADNPADYGTGIVRIVDGATCKLQYTITTARTVGADPVAIGDLNGDGMPEIVANADGGGVVAFTFKKNQNKWVTLWFSHYSNGSRATFGRRTGRWDGPTIADVDGDGKPEVISEAILMDRAGKVIADNLGLHRYAVGHIPVVADVDRDGRSELVTGDGVWTYNASSHRWVKESYFRYSGSDGYVALGDFGSYSEHDLHSNKPLPEVVVISNGTARIQSLSGRVVFGPFNLPNGGTGGPPTVADFDGDGQIEFATAGRGAYTVFDLQCNKSPVPFGCYKKGILWSMPSQDHSSSITGSSVFDFDRDGKAEAVYADECFVRVYDGSSGEVLFSWGRTSGTWNENPIIADVDGDHRAEIVIGSNDDAPDCPAYDPYFRGLKCENDGDCPSQKDGSCVAGYCRCKTDSDCGPGHDFRCIDPIPNTPGHGKVCRTPHPSKLRGLYVFKDKMDNWAASRPIWNQHAYYVDNVNDNGTIPKAADTAKHWDKGGLNNFRQNVQGDLQPAPAADLTASIGLITNCSEDGTIDVHGRVCNRGADVAPANIPVAFIMGPASSGNLQCLKHTTKPLQKGECEDFVCQYHVNNGAIDVSIWADYGRSTGMVRECNEDNNIYSVSGVTCQNLQ